jgi:hypothetical protein
MSFHDSPGHDPIELTIANSMKRWADGYPIPVRIRERVLEIACGLSLIHSSNPSRSDSFYKLLRHTFAALYYLFVHQTGLSPMPIEGIKRGRGGRYFYHSDQDAFYPSLGSIEVLALLT